jgi:beta-lactamase regulating signal transducer with metallopeptidase domain
MNLPIGLAWSATWMILVKWTTVLLLGWGVHWIWRDREARLRVVLWRTIFCFGVLLPITPLSPLPQFQILVHSPSTLSGSSLFPPEAGRFAQTTGKEGSFNFHRVETWPAMVGMFWAAGSLLNMLRLIHMHLRLSRLLRESQLAPAVLQATSQQIQRRLGLHLPIEVRISESATSAFVCGLAKPVIVLPRTLAEGISASEASALLTHEMAHIRNRDLRWCLCWSWMTVLFWFHPLVWKISAAHNLACEQEADRIASREFQDPGLYAQLLAQLALRLLALAPFQTQLAVHGTSQIARRLVYLSNENRSPIRSLQLWIIGSSMAACFLFLIGGWEVAQANASQGNGPHPLGSKDQMFVPEKAEPIEGTSVEPVGSVKVAKVTISRIGGATVDESLLRRMIIIKPGDNYDPQAVNADVTNLYKTGKFYAVRVSEDRKPEGAFLLFSVQGRAKLAEIDFTGNKKFSSAYLLEKISSKAGGLFDERKLFEDSIVVKSLYRESRNAKAEVRYSSRVAEDSGSARVVFTITEDPR